MIFEKKSLFIVVLLDPAEGVQYIEPVRDDDLDYIYKINTQGEDWVNPTADGRISWECKSSCTSDSDEEIERCHNRLHEVTTLNCNMMIRSLHCIKTEVMEMPKSNGLSEVDEFLNGFGSEVQEQQQLAVLKWALHVTPARWWGAHQGTLED